jgi:cytochrome c551/c552
MSLPEGRYAFSPSLGGHSFNVTAEVHEAGKVNNSGCLACHQDLKQVAGTEMFDVRAKADYDHDGTVEPVQMEVQGILAAFVNKNGTGYLQTMDPPMYRKDAEATFEGVGSGWANSRTGQWSESQMAALYNFKMIVEDRSLGVHNAWYEIQVLYDSLKAVDPGFDDSLRPR